MTTDETAPLFGVIGSPIAHSRSPELHRAAYAAIGLTADYDRTEVGEGGLATFLAGSSERRRGVSVTMPLKKEAWLAATERDRTAELTGVVNTLVRIGEGPGGRYRGANTDVAGIVGAVRGAGWTRGEHILVLGAGATAMSAVVAAGDLGATRVTLAVRSIARAADAERLGRVLGLDVRVSSLDDIADVGADAVVSTLPGGTPLEAPPVASLGSGGLLLDVAYSPWPSALASAAARHGATVVHGLSMLVHQAVQQVRLFTAADDRDWAFSAPLVRRAMFGAVGLPEDGIALLRS